MPNRSIRLDEAMALIRESLDSGHEVTFSPRGASMLPFLKEGRDTVTLTALPPKLKKYDIVFYQRDNGQYVLHRLVRVGKTYTCIGDHQYVYETGIRRDQIIAVCSSVVRGGKRISAQDGRWRLYAVAWHYSRPVRRVLIGVRSRLSHMIKR